jgi:hypothetical protein
VLNAELLESKSPGSAQIPGYPAPHTREFLLELDDPSDLVAQPAAGTGDGRQ